MSRAYSKKLAEAAIKNSEEFNLGDHDVLVGKGRGAFLSKGNQRYMELISLYAQKHRDAPTNVEKIQITNQVIATVTKRGGRFLAVDESGRLVQVSEKQARVKVGQALRHKRRKLARGGDNNNSNNNNGDSSSVEGSQSSSYTGHEMESVSIRREPAAPDFFLDLSGCSTLGLFHPVEDIHDELNHCDNDENTISSIRNTTCTAASSLSSHNSWPPTLDETAFADHTNESLSSYQSSYQYEPITTSLADQTFPEPSFPTAEPASNSSSKLLIQPYTPLLRMGSGSALMPSLEELMRNKSRYDFENNQHGDRM